LYQDGIDVSLSQLIEDAGELLLLADCRVGMRPVKATDGCYPDGTYLMFGHLGMSVLQ
jgi:hypothetical protein